MYYDNGNSFLATVTDLGLPDQQGSSATPEDVLQASKFDGGVRLIFDATTVCDLAPTR